LQKLNWIATVAERLGFSQEELQQFLHRGKIVLLNVHSDARQSSYRHLTTGARASKRKEEEAPALLPLCI
jgi:hypothetical protein